MISARLPQVLYGGDYNPEQWPGGTSSRVFREVKALGNELTRLDAVLGTRVPAAAAIVLDWESWWALELDTAKPAVDVRLLDQLQSYYRPLYAANVVVDFVRPDRDPRPAAASSSFPTSTS